MCVHLSCVTTTADCSLRDCPLGHAWADKATAPDTAHALVECSNAGLCDRTSGLCKCFEPFEGSACQRLKCPKDCDKHGVCMTMSDMARFYGAGAGTYTNWDADRYHHC